jgi:hypothetical protein
MHSCKTFHLDVKLCRLGLGVVQELGSLSIWCKLNFWKLGLETQHSLHSAGHNFCVCKFFKGNNGSFNQTK